jgi:aspartate kinase
VATAEQIRKVASIIAADSGRRYVVVSAPGKRFREDKKVTDLLYGWHRSEEGSEAAKEHGDLIRERFESIGRELGIEGVSAWIDEVAASQASETEDWMASRGEYLSARLIAAFLNFEFVDTADLIKFTPEGRLDPSTYEILGERLKSTPRAVLPGFYGSGPDGKIRTFSRGGSDITGAVVARAVNAALYENWTDVDGLLMADPGIVEAPRTIREVTYRELRELAYMGATVLHDEAIFPVRETGIPIQIRNTNRPEAPGTRISATRESSDIAVVGVAGRKGFTTIQIEKAMMNQEVGFGRRLLQVIEEHKISFEHAPSGIDSMSVIVSDEEIRGLREDLTNELQYALSPDRIEVIGSLALIATVGEGMIHTVGIAGRVFGALAAAGVNVRMINQGASELSIIVGVQDSDFRTAINAIYEAFVS